MGARNPRWSCGLEIAALAQLPIWSASALLTLQAWVAAFAKRRTIARPRQIALKTMEQRSAET